MNFCAECAKDVNSSMVPGVVMGTDTKTWYCEKHKPDLFYAVVEEVHAQRLGALVNPFTDQSSSLSRDGGVTIKQHSGNKYIRTTVPPDGCEPGQVDVYAVLVAFNVTNPGVQHALKKLLCAGVRGKGDLVKDLTEAMDALRRAVEIERARAR